jgi:hypothetical protein
MNTHYSKIGRMLEEDYDGVEAQRRTPLWVPLRGRVKRDCRGRCKSLELAEACSSIDMFVLQTIEMRQR